MARNGYPVLAVAAAATAALLAAPGGSQTPPPIGKTRTRTSQPAGFLKLAEKARRLKAVHAKGAGYVESADPLERPLPPEKKKVDFEVWVVPPAAKTSLATATGEVRVSDGHSAYTLIRKPGAPPRGRRRRITPQNFYDALDMAAVYCDAASGYANLARSVRFTPTAALPRHAKKFPALRWFQLQAVTSPPHHLVAGTEWVKMGLDPADGLVRVIAGVKVKEDRQAKGEKKPKVRVEISVVFEELVHGRVKKNDLKLPPAAAEAEWTDADTGRPIPAPVRLIAAKEP